jgi:hypothetical protein
VTALLFTAIGTHGVMLLRVADRVQELGIRLALGGSCFLALTRTIAALLFAATRRALALATDRYTSGLENLLSVLDGRSSARTADRHQQVVGSSPIAGSCALPLNSAKGRARRLLHHRNWSRGKPFSTNSRRVLFGLGVSLTTRHA